MNLFFEIKFPKNKLDHILLPEMNNDSNFNIGVITYDENYRNIEMNQLNYICFNLKMAKAM